MLGAAAVLFWLPGLLLVGAVAGAGATVEFWLCIFRASMTALVAISWGVKPSGLLFVRFCWIASLVVSWDLVRTWPSPDAEPKYFLASGEALAVNSVLFSFIIGLLYFLI